MVGIAIYQSKALFMADHRLTKIFKFIKGLVHNLQKKQAGTPLYGFIQTILKAEVNVGLRNIKLRKSPSE